MLKLLKFHNLLFKRHYSASKDVYLVQPLKNRTLLHVKGSSASEFLQGLITNDIEHLRKRENSSMYCMFLNSTGRVKYDSLIYNWGHDSNYLVECDIDAVTPLKDHLNVFIVRRKVIISLENSLSIWALIKQNNFSNLDEPYDYKAIQKFLWSRMPHSIATVDPRLPSLGLRVLIPHNFQLTQELERNLGVTVIEKDFYKLLRYRLGVGEGLKELPSEKCFPMEANGDYLHGISFHKGCYLGQELTARTYHTGVIRKRLMPLTFEEEITVGEENIPIFTVPQSQKSVGKLKGVVETSGVGLLRIDEALKADELMVLNTKCKTHRPFWWPNESPKERIRLE